MNTQEVIHVSQRKIVSPQLFGKRHHVIEALKGTIRKMEEGIPPAPTKDEWSDVNSETDVVAKSSQQVELCRVAQDHSRYITSLDQYRSWLTAISENPDGDDGRIFATTSITSDGEKVATLWIVYNPDKWPEMSTVLICDRKKLPLVDGKLVRVICLNAEIAKQASAAGYLPGTRIVTKVEHMIEDF